MKQIILISTVILITAFNLIGQCNEGKSQFLIESNGVQALLDTKGSISSIDNGIKSKNALGEWTSNLFAAGSWLQGNQLGGDRFYAISEYGEAGVDFYPGPIVQDQSSLTNCENWDKFFTANSSEIIAFLDDYNDNGIIDGTIPNSILGWPARSNPHFFDQHGFTLPDQDLAPFVDNNGDGLYNPEDGDFPKIKGNELIWWVTNDIGGVHNESIGLNMGFEVHNSAFVYTNEPGVMERTIFYELDYINKSIEPFFDFYFSMWMDPDLGCYEDDFFGCNPEENLIFLYNQDDQDGDSYTRCGPFTMNTYFDQIPMVGIKILESPVEVGANGKSFDYLRALKRGDPAGLPDSLYIEYEGDPADSLANTMCNGFLPVEDRRLLWGFGPTEMAYKERRKLVFAVYTTETQQYPCPSWDAVITDGQTIEAFCNSVPSSSNEALGKLSEVTIFPNPAFESVSIELEHSRVRVSTVTAYDITGRSSVLNKLDQSSFDIKHLNSGIYFLDIKLSGGKSLRQKLIVGK